MTLQTRKRLLNCLSAGLFALAGVVLLQVFSAPVLSEQDAGTLPPSGSGIRKPTAEVRDRSLVATDFERFWTIPLRRPLYDPPPPPPKVVEKPPPQPLRAKLIATIVEPGNSMAMLQLASGEVVFRKMGEEIGADDRGAKIAEIESGYVRIRRGEEEVKLTVDGRGE